MLKIKVYGKLCVDLKFIIEYDWNLTYIGDKYMHENCHSHDKFVWGKLETNHFFLVM